jgi:hypothetical protein
VIRQGRVSKVRGCCYRKLIDSDVYNNGYRYYKNAIINKDISPLVGIVFLRSRFDALFLPEYTVSLLSLGTLSR